MTTKVTNKGKIVTFLESDLKYHCPNVDFTKDLDIDEKTFCKFFEALTGLRFTLDEDYYKLITKLECRYLMRIFFQQVKDLIDHYVTEYTSNGRDYAHLESEFNSFLLHLIVTTYELRNHSPFIYTLPKRKDEPISYFFITFAENIAYETKNKSVLEEGWKYWKDHEDILKSYYNDLNIVDIGFDDEEKKPYIEVIKQMMN